MFRMFLRLGSLINMVLGVAAALSGNMPGAVFHMAAAILMDLQADVLFLKEEIVKLQPKKEDKDATQST